MAYTGKCQLDEWLMAKSQQTRLSRPSILRPLCLVGRVACACFQMVRRTKTTNL
jgi:hypothetical protein